eukprot:Pgem_evm1s19088
MAIAPSRMKIAEVTCHELLDVCGSARSAELKNPKISKRPKLCWGNLGEVGTQVTQHDSVSNPPGSTSRTGRPPVYPQTDPGGSDPQTCYENFETSNIEKKKSNNWAKIPKN